MLAKSLYQAVRSHLRRHRRLRNIRKWSPDDQRRLNFYRAFIDEGDLVFDVGANLGNRTKIFHRMGAEVVAVEPQTPCGNLLDEAFWKQPRFHLVRTALGAESGIAPMHISSASTISSLSSEWIDAVRATKRFGDQCWENQVYVEVQTLDSLIDQYGLPAFVKIDVEGFEDQVLGGLSVPIPSMSFEFTPEYIEATIKCIDRLCFLGQPLFQASLGESLEFALPEWCDADRIKAFLASVPTDSFGDIYTRFEHEKEV